MEHIKNDSPKPEAPRRRVSARFAAFWGIAVLGVGLLTWALSYVGAFNFTQQTLGDSLTAFREVTSVVEDTEGLCGTVSGTINCVEGWRTGLGDFMRFRGDSMAEYWHLTIGGESLRNGTLVVDMNGLDLSRDERELVVQMLFPGRDWE